MREYKFRGLCGQEWVYGNLLYWVGEDGITAQIGNTGPDDFQQWTVDPESVGQYASRKANGKEIYEGDIVEEGGLVGVIKWDDELARFVCVQRSWKGLCGLYLEQMKIIGNVHENPEILGEA